MPVRPETLALHAGWRSDAATHAVAVLSYQTTSCRFDGILADLSQALDAAARLPWRAVAE